MAWAVTAMVADAAYGAYQADQQDKANKEAERKNEANIQAMLASIGEGKREAELSLDEIMKLAQQRAGEEGRVAADFSTAQKQLKEGHQRSMGHLAGAEGQMQDQMQGMFESALGGAIGGNVRGAMGGGSMGMNLARMAGGQVMQTGMPLELTKMAAGQEAQYGAQQSNLTQAKSGATARAREQFLGGMQQAHASYGNLAQWQADSIRAARSGVQYKAAEVPDYLQGFSFSSLVPTE